MIFSLPQFIGYWVSTIPGAIQFEFLLARPTKKSDYAQIILWSISCLNLMFKLVLCGMGLALST
ncbi:hypothetical protein COO92_21545 [Thalassospira lohafexi]|uniref:Uncharacterized protein n=1 Tax=Thalassospira lohafexi TaxID=744227 RepID=A0A2N3L0N0_9PROT|nr:hypothetical protein COO92_21545 [Thalassospira lohafexi]